MTPARLSSWVGNLRLDGRDDVNRLAIMLGPVQSVIRVVDPRVPATRVRWADVTQARDGTLLSGSATEFRRGEIAINPLPVLEDKLDRDDQVDVCIGQALHEAGHSKLTRSLWHSTLLTVENGVERPAFEPMRVATFLLNIAEDFRTEGLTAQEWPGFAPYFDRLADWIWDGQKGYADRPEDALGARLQAAFLGVRFHRRAIEAGNVADREDHDWWHDWMLDYGAGRATPSETVERGLARLREDPQAGREMDEMSARDSRDRKLGESARSLMERLAKEGIEGIEGCIADFAEASGLTADDAEEVERLVREGLTPISPIILSRGDKAPPMRHRKPEESPESRRAYIGKPDPLTEAMRSALVFRQERPQHDLKLQRQGTLDDEELWRFGAGDDRLFSERVVEERPDTALGMLVDVSGSMRGTTGSGEEKVRIAQRLAQILLAAAIDTEGVTPYVWAHTGDTYEYGEGADVFTVWEPGDPATRLGLIGSLDNGNNYDGHAVARCVDLMRAMEPPQKVLIVLSDGLPAGHGYGGAEAQRHIRQVVQWAEGQGVTVIQMAIDEGQRPADQEAMYGSGHWLQYHSDRQVPRDLVRILGRYAR